MFWGVDGDAVHRFYRIKYYEKCVNDIMLEVIRIQLIHCIDIFGLRLDVQ